MPIRYRIGNIGTSSTDNCKLHLITHFILCLMCRADNSVCVLNNTISVEEVHCQLPAVYKLPEFPGVVASKLRDKSQLTPDLRRQIVNTLYEDVAKLTL